MKVLKESGSRILEPEDGLFDGTHRQNVLHIDFCGLGVMTHVLSILDHIDRSKWNHSVLHATDPKRPILGLYNDELRSRKVEAFAIKAPREISPYDLVTLFETCKIIRKVQPSVIHCHSAKAGAIGRTAALIMGRIPVIYTPHAFSFLAVEDDLVFKHFVIAVERILGHITDRIAAVSSAEKELAISERILPHNRIATILNGVDISKLRLAQGNRHVTRRDLGIELDEPVLSFVGRLASQKMPMRVVEVAKLLANDGLRPTFLIIGDGPLRADLLDKAVEYGVDAQFRFLGLQPHVKALDYLAASDVMLLPSEYEGLPYAVLEAQGLGVVPVICKFDGALEAVNDGETGYVIASSHTTEMTVAVTRLLRSTELRRKMSLAAMEYMDSHRNVKQTVAGIESLYQSVLLERQGVYPVSKSYLSGKGQPTK